MLEVNLTGSFCVTQPAWTVMKERGHGRIVMTGSAAGVYPEHGYSEYAAAKAGIVGLTRALAAEGAAHGIAVNAILPQAGGSAMTVDAGYTPTAAVGPEAQLAPYKSVDAVTPLVVHLCSPGCRHSGVIFSAGCGWFGRVFMGLTNGWTAPELGVPPTVEQVAQHMDEIIDTHGHAVPNGASDELGLIAERLGLAWSS